MIPTAREFAAQAIAKGASVHDLVTFTDALAHEADLLSRASMRAQVPEPYSKAISSWCPPEYLPSEVSQC